MLKIDKKMILKRFLLVWMILNAGTNIAMLEFGDPEIFDKIREDTDFASLDTATQAAYASQVNMRNHNGFVPLMTAIILRKPAAMLTWLITNGANVNAYYKDKTLLSHAEIYYTNVAAVEVLLKYHADATLTDGDGDTPLQAARKKLENIKWHRPMNRIELIINMLETEREQRAWDAKKTWIAGVSSHC